MATLNIGSGRTLKTLADALSHAKDNDTIILDPEVFDCGASTFSIKQNNLQITSAGNSTIKHTSPTTSNDATFLRVQGHNVFFAQIIFSVTNAWTATVDKFSDGVGFVGCTFTGPALGFDGIQLMNGKGVVLEKCTFSTTKNYCVFSGGAHQDRMSSGLTIKNCTFNGSGQHIIRTHFLDGLLVDGCEIHNEWDKFNTYHGACLNLRDGKNFIVKNTNIYGTFGVGPLPNSFDPLAKLDNVQISNCKMTGPYFEIDPDTTNIAIDGLELHASKSGNALNVGAVPGKAAPTGTVKNVKWEHTNGVFCKNQVPTIVWTNIQPFGASNQAEKDRLTKEITDLTAQIATLQAKVDSDKAALAKL